MKNISVYLPRDHAGKKIKLRQRQINHDGLNTSFNEFFFAKCRKQRSTALAACASDAIRADTSGLTWRSRPYSRRRPATCTGPTSEANAIALVKATPLACSNRGKCAAIAVLINHVTPKTNASNQASMGQARATQHRQSRWPLHAKPRGLFCLLLYWRATSD